MKKAVAYYRVSTNRQGESGLGLEAQQASVHSFAKGHPAEIKKEYVEIEKGRKANRPILQRALAYCRKHKALLIIAKLDRLTRSVKDLAELMERFQKRGVSLVSVAESLDTGSAAGRLVLNIMTAVSQWEREAIGERNVLRFFLRVHGGHFHAYGFHSRHQCTKSEKCCVFPSRESH